MGITVDLHGHDRGSASAIVPKIVQQAWEAGADTLTLIHGHGWGRALPRPFANTNTGQLGLCVRAELRAKSLRQWIFAKIDVSDPGCTVARLRPNTEPTRTTIDPIPEGPYS